jgi:hypothetical protein
MSAFDRSARSILKLRNCMESCSGLPNRYIPAAIICHSQGHPTLSSQIDAKISHADALALGRLQIQTSSTLPGTSSFSVADAPSAFVPMFTRKFCISYTSSLLLTLLPARVIHLSFGQSILWVSVPSNDVSRASNSVAPRMETA